MTVFEKLEEYIRKEISTRNDKISIIIKNENKRDLVISLLKNCEQPLDLINIDIQFIDKFDDFTTKDKDFIKLVIKQAKFLIKDCEGLDVQNQPQYKQVMNQLFNIYQLFNDIKNKKIETKEEINGELEKLLQLVQSMSKNGFKKEFNDFEMLMNHLNNSDLTENEKYEILQNLFVFNNLLYKVQMEKVQKRLNVVSMLTSIKQENVELPSSIEDSHNDEQFEEREIPEIVIDSDIMDIYCKGKEIVNENLSGIKLASIELSTNGELFGYTNAYEPGYGEYFQNNLNALKKVLLLKIYEFVEDIDSCFENGISSDDDREYVEIIVEEYLKPILDDYTKYIGSLDEEANYSEREHYDLIFLKNVDKAFNSNQLKEYFYRNQILSALEELKNGNFKRAKTIDSQDVNLYVKQKGGSSGLGGVNVCYVLLKSKIILILDVFTIQDGYIGAKSTYYSNKKLIKSLVEKSKDENNRDEILALNIGIGDQINQLLEEREKKFVGGRTNG